MPVAFVRNLGRAPGVQLNPLIDNSMRSARVIGDQAFGLPLRATRGRIDQAFVVDFATLQTLLGDPEPIRASELNEARAQLHEALAVSGGTAVVSRLIKAEEAALKWVVMVRQDPVAPATANSYVFGLSADPIGETGNVVTDSAGATIASPEPEDCIIQIKHLGCHNDGIRVSVWADPITVGGVDQATKILHLRIADADNKSLLFLVGSTDPNAKDDYGRSYYLPDVLARQSDAYEIEVLPNTTFAPGEALYGYTAEGREKRITSSLLVAFVEGGTDYGAADYQAAIGRLARARDDFSYLSSGGSQSAALLTQLASLAYESNRQLRFDVAGDLDVEAAVAFTEALNLSSAMESHLISAFWHPVRSADPSGVNPDGFFGTAMLNIAMTCRRNVTRNTKGLSNKHYPVAGRTYPIPRTGMRQAIALSQLDLNSIERTRINPVVFDAFSDGSFCVFRDQITQAPVENSLRKLISVVDMAADVDDRVTRFGKDLINSYPMSMAIKRMNVFLSDLFAAATTTGWLVPSEDMDGESYRFSVSASGERPYDMMDVSYSLRYEGAARQIVVTQTLSR